MSNWDDECMKEIEEDITKRINSQPPEKRLAYCEEQIKLVQDWQNRYWAAFDKILEDIKAMPNPIQQQLPKTQTTKLFTYGSLIRGLHNHEKLSEQKFIRQSTIIGNYTLFHCGWGYPFLEDSQFESTIKGEVYEVDDECLKRLDDMELSAGYERRTVVDTHKEEVQVYILKMKINVQRMIVHNGDWLECVTPYRAPITYYNIRDSKGRFCKTKGNK